VEGNKMDKQQIEQKRKELEQEINNLYKEIKEGGLNLGSPERDAASAKIASLTKEKANLGDLLKSQAPKKKDWSVYGGNALDWDQDAHLRSRE
jgi:hypothetical protein